MPLDFYRDTGGPIGRTIMDIAKVMNVLPGIDPLDSVTEIIAQQNVSTTTDYTAMLTEDVLQVRAPSLAAVCRTWLSVWGITRTAMSAHGQPARAASKILQCV